MWEFQSALRLNLHPDLHNRGGRLDAFVDAGVQRFETLGIDAGTIVRRTERCDSAIGGSIDVGTFEEGTDLLLEDVLTVVQHLECGPNVVEFSCVGGDVIGKDDASVIVGIDEWGRGGCSDRCHVSQHTTAVLTVKRNL